ncbi:hypothetical protein [Bosea thiooxidans]
MASRIEGIAISPSITRRPWDYVPIAAGGALIALFALEKILLFVTGRQQAPLGFTHFGLGAGSLSDGTLGSAASSRSCC